jgi:hypothetical protein
MHEETIPILRYGAAAPASESTPTISRSPWRQASGNNATWPAWNRSLTMSARYPVVVGGGTVYLPPVTDDIRLDLIESRTFDSRVIYERYQRVRGVP